MTQPMQATAPIEFSGSAASATPHFPTQARGSISADVLVQLASVCASSTDAATLAESGRDWWPLSLSWALRNETAALPAVVCRPLNTSEVSAVMRICHKENIPVTPAGGRSGVTGASIPLYGGVLLDLTSLQGIISVDALSGIVEVLPGTFGPDMETELNSQFKLTVGHYPQSFDISTVGGWIAYRGAGLAMTDVAAGHVDLTFTGTSQIKPFLENKRVRLLASSGPKRFDLYPQVRTIAEQGLKGFNASVWWGLLAPAGTPKEIVEQLNQALRLSMNNPEVSKKIGTIDAELILSSSLEFSNFLQGEIIRWHKLLGNKTN